MRVSATTGPGRGNNPVSVPIDWQDCAWKPRLLVRPGAPGFEWLNLGQPRHGRRIRGYRRLLKGARLRWLSRTFRKNRSRIVLLRHHR